MNADQVDQAIAATEPTQAPLAMAEIPVLLQSTGRPAVLGVPEDITDAEVMELTGWMLTKLRGHIAANLRPSRIEVVRGTLPPR